MPAIPPPRAQGFTTTTPVPLYWVEYGDPDAPPILLLHGGPAAGHEYLLPQMLALAEDHADVVVGSRNVPGGGTRNWGIGRKLISRGGSFYARTILGIDVRDVTAGFICWRRRALETLDLDTLGSNGYMFQIETKYRALEAGMKIVETPIIFVDRRVGQSKMSRAIVAEALTKVWALRFGR